MRTSTAFFALFALLFAGCQQEENSLAVSPSGITPSSPLSSLLSRVSQNATSLDNILDQSSCFSVNLPVTVIANGQQVTISDASGYGAVADIFDQSASDVDSVTFTYPISITYQNFQQQQIGSASQLQNAISQCANDDGLDELPCISIQYPVTINTYYTANQQA